MTTAAWRAAPTTAAKALAPAGPGRGSTDDDFADLDHRRQIGVVLDVGHDLLCIRPEAGLERLDALAVDVAHADIGRRRSGRCTRQTLVDRVGLAVLAHARLHHRHVFVAIVVVIESDPGGVRVHHADFDHGCLRVLGYRLQEAHRAPPYAFQQDEISRVRARDPDPKGPPWLIDRCAPTRAVATAG